MFHDIAEPAQDRLRWLEAEHARRNEAKLPTEQRLLQVSPETGRFLAIIAANAPAGTFLEVGTSGGYSGLWTALACRTRSNDGKPTRLITHEMLEAKQKLAAETFRMAGVDEWVELVRGNGLDHLAKYRDVAYCFLDGWKDGYRACSDAVVPNLVEGGVLLADNVLSHKEELAPWVDHIMSDERLDAVVVPIGNGVMLARRR